MFQGIDREITEYSGRTRVAEEIFRVQKLEAVGVLAAGIAHDFNNILQTIIGNISLIRIYMGDESRVITLLDNVEKAVYEAKGLSYRLLHFSQGYHPCREMTSIGDFIKAVFSLTLNCSDIVPLFEIHAGLYPVYVDRMQLNQVFCNLALNAREAMPKGGTLMVRAKNADLCEKDDLPLRKGRYIQITISDQGNGIPEANLLKIFDPYFSTKERGSRKGQGLGLAISYSIIRKHEGLIMAKSKPGNGSTFIIYLPACRGSDAEQS